MAGERHDGRLRMGSGHGRRAGGGPRQEPRGRPLGGVVPHAQGPRLRGRQQEPRHALADERARVLGRPPRVHGPPRSDLRGRGRGGAGRCHRALGEARHNLEVAISVLRANTDVVDAVSDRLLEVAGLVPEQVEGFHLGGRGAEIFDDPRFTDVTGLPRGLCQGPGREGGQPGRAGVVGAWVNATARADYDRPLFIVCSADLAESTNIAGFAKDWEDLPGWGWYNRETNLRGRCCRSRSPSSRTAA